MPATPKNSPPPLGGPPIAHVPPANRRAGATSQRALPQTEVLQRTLLGWFADNARALPWRARCNPYAVWISEMMLQQTRVETVLPYFGRWMERFPQLRSVAGAPLEDVLKLWEGLGYYSRARALHRAAAEMVARHGGQPPRATKDLRALPGIGVYTAGAIASIAYNQPVAAVDGNTARVLSRLFALQGSPAAPAGRRKLAALAQGLIPPGRARDFNQALMELGALVCRAGRPPCQACPLRRICLARRLGRQGDFPPPVARPRQRPVRGALALVISRGRLLLRRRPPRGLWGGLWELPWIEAGPGESTVAAFWALAAALGLEPAGEAAALGTVRHGLTHLKFELACFAAKTAHGGRVRAHQPGGETRWVAPARLAELPLAKPSHKALALWRLAAHPGRRGNTARAKRAR